LYISHVLQNVIKLLFITDAHPLDNCVL